ncbi:hypothetical protein FI667_g1287, partial [Globisporangium splendens]
MATFFTRWTQGTGGAGKNSEPFESTESSNQKHEEEEEATTAVGSEWILIEEPVGFFFPEMKMQRQLLELDQVRHVLHYAKYKRVMRIHDISLVTSVEEIDRDGTRRWWMTIQDPRMLQVWVVHFPSLQWIRAWIDLLRSVVFATGSRAFVSDIVLAAGYDRNQSLLTYHSSCTGKQEARACSEPENQDSQKSQSSYLDALTRGIFNCTHNTHFLPVHFRLFALCLVPSAPAARTHNTHEEEENEESRASALHSLGEHANQ